MVRCNWHIVKVQMASRFTQENKKVEVKLSYTTGLDRYYGLLDLAEKYDIIKKVSTRYEMPDGTKVFGKTINQEPEKYFTEDIMTKLEEVAKKEFCPHESTDELSVDEDGRRQRTLSPGDKVYWQHWYTWEDNVVNLEYPTRCGASDLIDEEDVEIISEMDIVARKARGFVVAVHEPTKVKTSIREVCYL